MIAVPKPVIFVPLVAWVWIPTLTTWPIPYLYPEPALLKVIARIVPAVETVAVPPAATNGWYPNPSVDPTDTITPPTGRLEVLTSLPIDVAVPVNLIDVTPRFSFMV